MKKKKNTAPGLCLLRIERQKALEGKHPFGSLKGSLDLLEKLLRLYRTELPKQNKRRDACTAPWAFIVSNDSLRKYYHAWTVIHDLRRNNEPDYTDDDLRKASGKKWYAHLELMQDDFHRQAIEEIAYQQRKLKERGERLDIVELHLRLAFVGELARQHMATWYNEAFPYQCRLIMLDLCEDLVAGIMAADISEEQRKKWLYVLEDRYIYVNKLDGIVRQFLPWGKQKPPFIAEDKELFSIDGKNYTLIDSKPSKKAAS